MSINQVRKTEINVNGMVVQIAYDPLILVGVLSPKWHFAAVATNSTSFICTLFSLSTRHFKFKYGLTVPKT